LTRKLDLRNLALFIIAGLVIAFDQYTKAWIRSTLAIGESLSPIPALSGILSFTHIQNQGAAFGLFPGLGSVFLVVAVIVVLAISFFSGRLARSSALLWLAFGLQLGGATGNLIDRLTQHGFVTDFVNFHVFAVFNVADSAIVVVRCCWPTMPW
jgi:signal peptidase II